MSPDDGLVLKNVTLGSRLMAEEIGLPYYMLADRNGRTISRCELKPDGGDPACRSRLVDFRVDDIAINAFIIRADYAVDLIPGAPSTCLEVVQRYEFRREVFPTVDPGLDPCEPTGSIPCARFFPTVSYALIPPATGSEFDGAVNTVQRFHFKVDALVPNAAGIFKDTARSRNLVTRDIGGNPLAREKLADAIRNGGEARADNFHQTSKPTIQEPQGLTRQPGCAECVHIHWRWLLLAGPSFGLGNPLIPAGSNQDVEIAVTLFRPGEEDPFDFRALVDNESLVGGEPVFWYSSHGHQQSDTFFIHGGFFSSIPPSP